VLAYGGTVGTAHWQNGNTSTGGTGADVDGLVCASGMAETYHVHAHLAIVSDGQWLALPANVGIVSQCNYEMHTHDSTGIIHIETPNMKTFTLGQFFDIWGMNLSTTQAAGLQARRGHRLSVWVNGAPYAGDPNKIVLKNHETIVIQNGPPFVTPAKVNWGSL